VRDQQAFKRVALGCIDGERGSASRPAFTKPRTGLRVT
jgi:hypothetical protein